ncbi:unnamed protein product [Vitrella brassicaformis CCMP3155]|uniref:Radical SAM core domain-containing protein n=2 Tax=Vitrella brassicaformis TaxID=1169539 RepID=A0A0G4G6Q7_VITBC|nr:unnamed protein product [Vitrella brassicaformis CCMP3155]|eukprot:CEM24053.1 unnamed protein product [Vitrella brassicaformis CCMP3155]
MLARPLFWALPSSVEPMRALSILPSRFLSTLASQASSSVPRASTSPFLAIPKAAQINTNNDGAPLYAPMMDAHAAAGVLGDVLKRGIGLGEVVCLGQNEIHGLMEMCWKEGSRDERVREALFAHANEVTRRFFGNKVFYRGLIEFSNVCQNDCLYCGIRKNQPNVERYTISKKQLLSIALWAHDNGYGSVMLQSGELNHPARMKYLTDVITAIRRETVLTNLEKEKRHRRHSNQAEDPAIDELIEEVRSESFIGSDPRFKDKGIGIALSVGELSEADYRRLHEAGGHRYLLRIESSNPELYSKIHPPTQPFAKRLACLRLLKKVGFQVGSGVMIGIPGQTLEDLARDIVFFRDEDIDMVGMGPYITQEDTPVADMWQAQYGHVDKKEHMAEMFDLTTVLISICRITMGNINIAATTALQAINANGREVALRRGANVLMPILTPTQFRENYQLYEGKPCITDTAEQCKECLNFRLKSIGKEAAKAVWGDPPHFYQHVRSHHTLARRSFSSKPSPAAPKSPGASELPRINIGFFGAMNAGKSTLMNKLTRSNLSIVDATPGTTADTKITLMELHDIGPTKLFDTAGIDERGELGEKKRRKTISVLKESDIALLVVDPLQKLSPTEPTLASPDALQWERYLIEMGEKRHKEVSIVFNIKEQEGATQGWTRRQIEDGVVRLLEMLDPSSMHRVLCLDLGAPEASDRLVKFIQSSPAHGSMYHDDLPCVPESYLTADSVFFLNIPMDAETPAGRLLRPQAMVQESIIRHYGTTVAYRMDLAKARSSDPAEVQEEKSRFLKMLNMVLQQTAGPKLLITDSQAMDIVHPWTLDPVTNRPLIDITTFSIALLHRQSGGQLPTFVEGLERFKHIKQGDRVLVAEGCNHNRITQLCNDIATVQLPGHIRAQGGASIAVDHAFGREFPDIEDQSDKGLGAYSLVIHCGGCYIDKQKVQARVDDLREMGVPVTNFGLLLSYVAAPEAVDRALQPWGLTSV